MYLKRIEMENVRGLPKIAVNLVRNDGTFPKFIVIAGRNGSGKTSLLQAIALAIYGEHLGKQYPQSWMRKGKSHLKAQVDIGWDGTGKYDPSAHQVISGLFEFRNNKIHESDLFSDYQDLFLVGYGSMRRMNGDASYFSSRDPNSPEDRVITLFHEGAALREVVAWVEKLYLRSLEKVEGANELFTSVRTLLNHGLLPQEAAVSRISSDGIFLTFGDPPVEEELKRASDGYRSSVAMVLDLCRQLHQKHGYLEMDQQTGCCSNRGVVLIDELDAHLHISWQSKIGFWLKQHFPNIQFIVTTHSPFICQAADPGGLLRLPRHDQETLEVLDENDYFTVVNGSLNEAVLSTLFGMETTHSASSELLRQRLAQLDRKLARDLITEAEVVERKELIKKLPQTGSMEIERMISKALNHCGINGTRVLENV